MPGDPPGDQAGQPGDSDRGQKRTLLEMWGVQQRKQRSSWRKNVKSKAEAAEYAEELGRLTLEHSEQQKIMKWRAAEASRSGQLRRKHWSDCRDVARSPLLKSNRLQPGMKRRRWDCNPHDGLIITKKYEEMMKRGAPDQAEVLHALKKV